MAEDRQEGGKRFRRGKNDRVVIFNNKIIRIKFSRVALGTWGFLECSKTECHIAGLQFVAVVELNALSDVEAVSCVRQLFPAFSQKRKNSTILIHGNQCVVKVDMELCARQLAVIAWEHGLNSTVAGNRHLILAGDNFFDTIVCSALICIRHVRVFPSAACKQRERHNRRHAQAKQPAKHSVSSHLFSSLN